MEMLWRKIRIWKKVRIPFCWIMWSKDNEDYLICCCFFCTLSAIVSFVFSPLCLRPWTHTCCSVWGSSSAVLWTWLPGPDVSSGTDEPHRPSPRRPPHAPHQKWFLVHLYNTEGEICVSRILPFDNFSPNFSRVCVCVCVTCKVLQHAALWERPASWLCCGFVTTDREPSLLWRSYLLWPASQKLGLLGETHTHTHKCSLFGLSRCQMWSYIAEQQPQ